MNVVYHAPQTLDPHLCLKIRKLTCTLPNKLQITGVLESHNVRQSEEGDKDVTRGRLKQDWPRKKSSSALGGATRLSSSLCYNVKQ